jgi:hypothetical protein
MLDPIFDHLHLLPELTPEVIIAAAERHLAVCAAQLAEKEEQKHRLFSGAIDAKDAGNDEAALRLMKTYLRLLESIEQIKRLAAKEEAVKVLALRRLRSLENYPRDQRERCPNRVSGHSHKQQTWNGAAR